MMFQKGTKRHLGREVLLNRGPQASMPHWKLSGHQMVRKKAAAVRLVQRCSENASSLSLQTSSICSKEYLIAQGFQTPCYWQVLIQSNKKHDQIIAQVTLASTLALSDGSLQSLSSANFSKLSEVGASKHWANMCTKWWRVTLRAWLSGHRHCKHACVCTCPKTASQTHSTPWKPWTTILKKSRLA